jgi:hypothetical protein
MNRDGLLEKLQLKDPQLKDLLKKFKENFYDELDDEQRTVVRRSLPSLHEALTWLGPDVTVDQLRELFGGAFHADGEPIMVCHFAHTHRVS